MGKEIVKKEEGHFPSKWNVVEKVAEKLFRSGLFTHLKNPAQAVAIVEYGRELGVAPMQALSMMAIINGKLAMSSQLMLALVKRHGCDVKIVEQNSKICQIKFIRDGKEYNVSFTMEEAKRMGLADKDNWKKQPENMLFWRAVSKAIRYHAPDLMLGVYTIEEMTEGKATTPEELVEAEIYDEWEVKPGYEKIKQIIRSDKISEQDKEILKKGILLNKDEGKMLDWILNKYPDLLKDEEIAEVTVVDDTKEVSKSVDERTPTEKQTEFFETLLQTHTLTETEKETLKQAFRLEPSEVINNTQKMIKKRHDVEKILGKGKLAPDLLKRLEDIEKEKLKELANRLKVIKDSKIRDTIENFLKEV